MMALHVKGSSPLSKAFEVSSFIVTRGAVFSSNYSNFACELIKLFEKASLFPQYSQTVSHVQYETEQKMALDFK